MHKTEPQVVLEYLDFYKKSSNGSLRYAVFDSRFTNYENLSRLDGDGVFFITIRRRGKNLEGNINGKTFKKIRIESSNLKGRQLKVVEERITLNGYMDPKTGNKKKSNR